MSASSLGDAAALPTRIRQATLDDAEAIARIYNHYVLHETCTFSTVAVDVEERVEWLRGHVDPYIVLVAESDEVVGFGSLSRYGVREAWSPTVEVSVYVDFEQRKKGVGRALMEELMIRARTLGHHAVIGQVVADNTPSLKLAAEMGFERVGYLREVGEKFGRRLDVVLMERVLD